MSGPVVPASYDDRKAVNLDDLLDKSSAPGWDFFEKLLGKDQDRFGSPPLDARSQDAAAAAARIFATDDGAALLEFLADVSVRRPVFILGMPDPVAYGAMREGQNALFFTLLKLIATGRGEQPPVREGA